MKLGHLNTFLYKLWYLRKTLGIDFPFIYWYSMSIPLLLASNVVLFSWSILLASNQVTSLSPNIAYEGGGV